MGLAVAEYIFGQVDADAVSNLLTPNFLRFITRAVSKKAVMQKAAKRCLAALVQVASTSASVALATISALQGTLPGRILSCPCLCLFVFVLVSFGK